MIESIALPGLAGKTVVVLDAGDTHGPAVCGSLLASDVIVIATGVGVDLPASLVDAGTGLDGELHYRPLPSVDDWPAVAEWITAKFHEPIYGIVGAPLGLPPALEALAHQLVLGAVIVSVDEGTLAPETRSGVRSNSIVLAGGRGSRPEGAAAAVAFLLSDLARLVDGAVIPVGERPAPAI